MLKEKLGVSLREVFKKSFLTDLSSNTNKSHNHYKIFPNAFSLPINMLCSVINQRNDVKVNHSPWVVGNLEDDIVVILMREFFSIHFHVSDRTCKAFWKKKEAGVNKGCRKEVGLKKCHGTRVCKMNGTWIMKLIKASTINNVAIIL